MRGFFVSAFQLAERMQPNISPLHPPVGACLQANPFNDPQSDQTVHHCCDRSVIYIQALSVHKGNNALITLKSTLVHKKVYLLFMHYKCMNIKNI